MCYIVAMSTHDVAIHWRLPRCSVRAITDHATPLALPNSHPHKTYALSILSLRSKLPHYMTMQITHAI